MTKAKRRTKVIETATRRYLARERLDRFVRHNEERARELGIIEADVPRLVKEWRRERRERRVDRITIDTTSISPR